MHARMLKTATTQSQYPIHSFVGRIHTDFHTIPAKVKSRKNHLSQSETGTEGREEANRHYTQEVDKEDDKDRIDEAQVEDGVCQCADCFKVHQLRTENIYVPDVHTK